MEETLSASGDNKPGYREPRHTPVSRNTRQVWEWSPRHKLLKCTVIEISRDSIINEEEYVIAATILGWLVVYYCCIILLMTHMKCFYYRWCLYYKPPLRQSYNPLPFKMQPSRFYSLLLLFYFTPRCEIGFPSAHLIGSSRPESHITFSARSHAGFFNEFGHEWFAL